MDFFLEIAGFIGQLCATPSALYCSLKYHSQGPQTSPHKNLRRYLFFHKIIPYYDTNQFLKY